MTIEQQIMGCRSMILVRPNGKVSRPKHNRGVHWAKSAPLVPHHAMVLGYEALCWQEHGAFFSGATPVFRIVQSNHLVVLCAPQSSEIDAGHLACQSWP